MEIQLYNSIIEKINNLGVISGLNINEYLELSNQLIDNLEKIKQIDINKLVRHKDIDNYREILIQINTYKQNEEYIRNLNEYIKSKHKELSFTLQYQRNQRIKKQIHKKNIYSNN